MCYSIKSGDRRKDFKNLTHSPQRSRPKQQECSELVKQLLPRGTAQHRRSNTSAPVSAVYLHLKDKGHSFDSYIRQRGQTDWERGAGSFVRINNLSLNRGGELRLFSGKSGPIHTYTRLVTLNNPSWGKEALSEVKVKATWRIHLCSPQAEEATWNHINLTREKSSWHDSASRVLVTLEPLFHL